MHVCVIDSHSVVEVGLRFIRLEDMCRVDIRTITFVIASLVYPVCALPLLLDGAAVSVCSSPGVEVGNSELNCNYYHEQHAIVVDPYYLYVKNADFKK